ncbi:MULTISPECIES: 30S ribosomal protein S1 [Oceanobacillus]|uniref:30S ribosomal protein S1 n=1 Tax=Oceanobacillus kimchii TaxID=746691 RepID=A0ABQ5THV9_9BACI|nr:MULTISPECIES: 30S ribosomal protein S1 [Oceanobacillus]MBT2598447.1 30S ribosomal protein S1 [Oceanobacillus sp. ISL-74]MBT2651365.1 30S ribosomal protein S1 [Oceanobacillus sp. ISL-73]MCT1576024.1 30S ribosomal protein S1 [Oceanobacillus kimchii]MCT2135661.1 30S ribosomal protein S1 [Oceanobacillus kimchii]GLO66456.1 30S ribosomal protein S1 [Oceanobacillus kimchii]
MSEESKNLQTFEVGSTVTGTVVKLEDKQVLVDIGYKTEGILPIGELSSMHVEATTDVLSEGDTVSLKVKKIDDDEIILSKRAVDSETAWEDLEQKYNSGEAFETTVKEVVKGGLVVDVGVRGFIPASLVETYYVEDFSDYLNKSLKVKIADLDRSQNRVILSHRAIVEEEEKSRKNDVLQSLEPGQVIEGTVQRITNFGAFVDLGGVDGLVHISQLAHEHVEKTSDVVSEGDKIKVEVLSVDLDNERISLSHKNTLPGPWANVEKQIKAGSTIEGTVKRLVSFGAFVELLPGVEGLVHISQIANRHIGTPQEVLEIGQTVQVKVLDVSEEDQRISLSIKELEEEQEAKEFKQYEKDDDQSGFQLGDFIGDKLDKYK